MAILNRIVQISPEPCDSVFSIFGDTQLGLELQAQTLNIKTGENVGEHSEGEHVATWMIWPDADDKDECVAKQKAIMDKYPDTVAQMKQYIADNNITFEDHWYESFEPTEADQAWLKTFAE